MYDFDERTIADLIATVKDHELVGACECSQQTVRRWRKGAIPNLRYAPGIAKATGQPLRLVRSMIDREFAARAQTKSAVG